MLGPASQQIAGGVVFIARSSRARRRVFAAFAARFVACLFLISLSRLNHVTEFLYSASELRRA